MTSAALAAGVAAVPPTLAALLAFANARATRRLADAQAQAGIDRKIDALGQAAGRSEAALEHLAGAVGRLAEGQCQLIERVARIEGALGGPRGRP